MAKIFIQLSLNFNYLKVSKWFVVNSLNFLGTFELDLFEYFENCLNLKYLKVIKLVNWVHYMNLTLHM